MKNVLITGITGQDGVFLTSEILKNNPNLNIFGTTRKKNENNFYFKLNQITNSELGRVNLINIDLTNPHEVTKFIGEIKPISVYNLSGPSSVYKSFENSRKTKFVINNIFDNLTDAIIKNKVFSYFYQASSSEMFGVQTKFTLDENCNFNPNSPYAEAKLECHKKILKLSEKYDWRIYSGIMFNHESEFRENEYLFMKIINGALNIKNGKLKKLKIGSLDYVRDWSYAGDVCKAIYAITNFGTSNSYVIGSGIGNSIKDLVEIVFSRFNLDFNNYLDIDQKLIRKGDPKIIIANPKKIKDELKWTNKIDFEKLVNICIDSKVN